MLLEMNFIGKSLLSLSIALLLASNQPVARSAEIAKTQGVPAQLVSTPAERESQPNFWAFQRFQEPAAPSVKDRAWISNPLDNFILAALEAKNLKPAKRAGPLILLRRATFDLTGLPPTAREITDFLADQSPGGFARVVDRLLASPQYGERWGRHWLDVARYADSNGLDENVAHGNAWRYRDYVVASFNRDKPFDQFVIEQLAGDLLPAANDFALRQERLIATGFLSLGPKVLAEPDPQKMEMDIIDEQIDTVGRTFMGLTIGCARCHDHKFDPIPITDYYALAGIFKSTKTMDNYKIVAQWHENSLATPAELAAKAAHDKAVTDQKVALTNFFNQINQRLANEARLRVGDYLLAATKISNASDTNQLDRVAMDSGLNVAFLKQWHQYLSKNAAETNSVFFGTFLIGTANQTTTAVSALFATSDYSTPRELADLYAALFREAEQAAQGCATNTLPEWKLEAARKLLADPKGPFALPSKIESSYSRETAHELKRKREEITGLEARSPELPTTMGVEEGDIIESLAVHVRGSHLSLGEKAPKQFPRVLGAGSDAPIGKKESGRLQLALWLASPDHPLTSRVMANRIWRWHFGQGLVATPDNFGKLGERPINQPLLDWLATQFVKTGWSIKAMHKLIMLSSTYQMSSAPNPAAAALDPENRLLSRMNVRRLEAEAIRDAILAVSGKLDLSMGGKALQLKNREFVFNHESKDATRYEGYRRSMYQPIIRNHLYDVLELFDFPDPAIENGDRTATTIAPQALFMLNSDLMLDAAERLARELLENGGASDRQRIEAAYLKCYARHPTTAETQRVLDYLKLQKTTPAAAEAPDSATRRLRIWQDLCQILLAANEFVYLK